MFLRFRLRIQLFLSDLGKKIKKISDHFGFFRPPQTPPNHTFFYGALAAEVVRKRKSRKSGALKLKAPLLKHRNRSWAHPGAQAKIAKKWCAQTESTTFKSGAFKIQLRAPLLERQQNGAFEIQLSAPLLGGRMVGFFREQSSAVYPHGAENRWK